VTRKRSRNDRRRQELYLTAAGEKALHKVKAHIIEHENRFKSLFEPAELAALLSALKKFRAFDS
jgi:DNA-binding MarR family transcriptional regulator